LVIRNYAIIDHLVIEPDKNLNTVTGETGAGKSIILGALSLILGDRADTSVLINKQDKCVVEAVFDVENNATFKAELAANELDVDDLCIIRREISTSGKSRAFINDTPVNLNLLNKLTSLLVDLHQQFGHLALEDDRFQMDVIDAIAGNEVHRKTYEQAFKTYQKLSRQLQEYKTQQAEWQRDTDYKQFLYDELLQASFKEDEIEHAEQHLKQLTHAERMIAILQAARVTLEEGEQPLVNELKRLSQQMQGVCDVMEEAKPLQARLLSSYAELKDIASELELFEKKISLDPESMAELQARLDLGYRLCKKHGVANTSALLSIQNTLETELQASLNLNDTIESMMNEVSLMHDEVMKAAAILSEKRAAALPIVATRVNELLRLVGMPNAVFNIEIHRLQQPDRFGMDKIAFMMDANKSGNFQPVYKAASGGEMSRIMLCIKSLTAKAMHLPTLIFDEVDSGISGEAAKQVGLLLSDLGAHHQIICITHQPQVAARGGKHFFVYKEMDAQGRINTKVKALQQEERVFAIAQMIGGEKPSDAALQNARELVVA